MACLKAGNLTAAREKFSRCLKPPFDINQLSHGSRLVLDVVEYLESTVRPLLSVVRARQAEGPLGEGGPGAVMTWGKDPLPLRAARLGFCSFHYI